MEKAVLKDPSLGEVFRKGLGFPQCLAGVLWWPIFIANLTGFRITVKHTCRCVYGGCCFQKGLTKEGRSIPNVGTSSHLLGSQTR